ncbi:hypothetical protein ONS95_013709 [Cadophora gregata]|uniref:uncharacterized protein n=1 Tax=Cadophora gregata TaxID=51156 RepID=UPI0026DD355E|nr:uncharacterized protein ONS95_013709 [Cadophora gregata]KAK0113450.1 hypothetical protein ONS96_014316 [Cadophora gregata f. sp. sojae]KAK0114209.1 hypothetical protein ONS95_013709 [Cadophora gregata]
MAKISFIITLTLNILGATAKDCPSDRFPDCCASYGFASLDTMKNTFDVPISKITDSVMQVGYVWEWEAVKLMVLKHDVARIAGRAGVVLEDWVLIVSEMMAFGEASVVENTDMPAGLAPLVFNSRR